jgi:alpha-N-arabinofuranosidase
MDEWNYWYGPHIYGELGTRYFYRDAMGIAAGINEFSRNSDIIFMANYAQTVNVIGAIKTSTTESVLASTGQVLKMYRHYFGSIPVSLTGDTRPLDMAAALTEGRDTLTLSVINPTYDRITFPMTINGASASGEMEIWSVEAPDDMSYNEPGREMAVKIVNRTGGISKNITVEPTGIMIFRIPLSR